VGVGVDRAREAGEMQRDSRCRGSHRCWAAWDWVDRQKEGPRG
jgi:hypothetical protein